MKLWCFNTDKLCSHPSLHLCSCLCCICTTNILIFICVTQTLTFDLPLADTPYICVLFSPSASLLSLSASGGNHLSWAGCFIMRSSSLRPKFKLLQALQRCQPLPCCTLPSPTLPFLFHSNILQHQHCFSAVPSIIPPCSAGPTFWSHKPSILLYVWNCSTLICCTLSSALLHPDMPAHCSIVPL